MLQDLEYGRLENEYRPVPPVPADAILCFRGGDVLLHRSADNTLTLPTWAELHSWGWGVSQPRYAFRLQGTGYYLLTAPDGDAPAPYTWELARKLRQHVSMETCYAILTGWHLQNWYQNNRLCGSCGAKTVHDEKERMLRCPTCGNLIFPRINPAIITAVTDGDRLLLSRYAGRGYTHFALLAGYTEIGETIEQTVHREVFEEVGLRVKNLRYYKSQPWGVDGNILMGFFCDLDGDDTISLDETELSHAGWYDRHALPIGDDGFSLTREMIRIFGEGKEPK
ncbi:MAG: NAD(+) diphosphatase [Oscillospiraceae bacterium]|nr:NAD(+) diphosphatase [Oscillospiraceae bacterium]